MLTFHRNPQRNLNRHKFSLLSLPIQHYIQTISSFPFSILFVKYEQPLKIKVQYTKLLIDINSHIQMLKNNKKDKAKVSKNRNQTILTIYSSQKSVLQTLPKGTSLPLKKINKTSVPNLNTRNKEGGKKVKHSLVSMKNRPIEIYEKIPMHFVNSNTNSDIEFSNYGETRGKNFKKTLHIDCDQQALIKEIWRQDKKKQNIQQKAAIKIQKVFRGYLTRKLLMKYVEEYQEKLMIEKQLLERRMKEKYEKDDSFIGNSKKQFFPSKKPSISHQQWSNDKYNPLDFESSIMIASIDHQNSLRDQIHNTNTYDRRQQQLQRDSLTLNESLIARQHEISMSFGQENQHSPHFMNINKRRNSKQIYLKSPKEQDLKPTHYISQDKTGDGFSQNISSCPSYSKPYKKLQESRMSSMREQVQLQRLTERESIHLQNLRSIQKAKWQQVIELVNDQMKQGINQEKTRQLMSYILEFSVKNREELNQKSPYQITPTTITQRQEQIENTHQNQRHISFKKKKWKQAQQIQKSTKNENLPLIRKPKEDKSVLERTSNMKQYFLKNLSIQDQQVDKMMSIRQAVLRRKESNSLIELNHLLQNNELTQDDFLQRMSSLTNIFSKHKKDIEQTKDQIYQGYRAQLQLFKNTVLDAKYLGYHIPFCRSMEIYPNNSQWRFDEVMIDELNQRAMRRVRRPLEKERYNMHQLSTKKIDQLLENHSAYKEKENEKFEQSQSEEQSANFSYEQTNIYDNNIENDSSQAVLSPKNMKIINNFNRYSTIAIDQDFYIQGRRQKKLNNSQQKSNVVQEQQQEEYVSLKRMPKKQTFKIDYSSDEEEETLYQESNDKQSEELASFVFNKLVFDFLEEMFKNLKLVGSFNLPNPSHRMINSITKQQKLSFIHSTTSLLPNFQQISQRLNQKMYPNTKQLLVSMREDCQQNESEHQYYQIGQYQYILNQEICFQAIDTYIQRYKESRRSEKKENRVENGIIANELEVFASSKMKEYLKNYTKILKNKSQELQQLRCQVLKIELHLVLDAWNELLIKHRQNKVGYSGIGLNEITFSLIDRICKPMTKQCQWQQMIVKTKERLQQIIKSDQLHQKLIKEYEQFVSQNDSQWILYAQEGLQYGFDLTKAVQVELVFELLEELHHINQVKASQFLNQSNEINNEMEQDDGSLSSSQNLQLNEDEQQQLKKKMEKMKNYEGSEDSDESLFD